MKILKGRPAGAASAERSETFTGVVWSDPVLPTTDGITVNNVFFTPGARTHWHHHENGQLLVVTLGSGLVCTRGGPPHVLGAGDVVWAPPGEHHWHGGGESSCLQHLAMSLGATTWLDAVSDGDFLVEPLRSEEPVTE